MATGNWRVALTLCAAVCLMVMSGWSETAAAAPQAVVTYHYDNLRTGWNSNETQLTPANVNSTTFGLLHKVTLDEQADAQPLLVPGVTITAGSHQGKHDVVYVATENNSIYAIDASSGVVLLNPRFGTPVHMTKCNNNGPLVGINSTPAIDVTTGTLYAMIYSSVSGVPTYTIHALDLGDLHDKVTPVTVKASHVLADGSSYAFDATVSRQRPGLLLANGNVYAGFGSFCDHNVASTRGWILGWNAKTLADLAGNKLTDTQTKPESTYYLSSVWMSGYGLAADASGEIYFVTGNSDRTKDVYNGVTDIQESVVKLSSDLKSVSGLFTPSDHFTLDENDRDYGSGGVLLLPTQLGATPDLAAAAGKEGNLFLLNRQALGGSLDEVAVGKCWCGPSYFSDGTGHLVTSGGNTVNLWTVDTSTSGVKLVNVGSQTIHAGVQDPGFFTTISSSGSSNAIIWAVSRAFTVSHSNGTTTTQVNLYALNAKPSSSKLPMLFSAPAGSWPNLGGNSNLVPVVANGHVYVASHEQLAIFGLLPASGATDTVTAEPMAQNSASGSQHEIFGTITALTGSTQFTLQTRTGSLVSVDATNAVQADLSIGLDIGEAVDVQGTFDGNSVLQAGVVQRAKDSPEAWPNDT